MSGFFIAILQHQTHTLPFQPAIPCLAFSNKRDQAEGVWTNNNNCHYKAIALVWVWRMRMSITCENRNTGA
ncbi:hypothetical protein HHX48_12765 [Salinimonas sp. HHU 13199]|uniref:Uncharacterized protein n=1 Tax=Salinimonas profundi TaxID=2729140 RepID=A0ABR8LLK0_9ALTE|nr:hypothetical protein [Salinimonas profundi]MBD3586612.1 hypothetical protein [Salinimonas profundi]